MRPFLVALFVTATIFGTTATSASAQPEPREAAAHCDGEDKVHHPGFYPEEGGIVVALPDSSEACPDNVGKMPPG